MQVKSYRAYISTVRLIQATLVALPIGMAVVKAPRLPIPPFGAAALFIVGIGSVIVGLAGIVPWLLPTQRVAKFSTFASLALLCVSGYFYILLASRLIVEVDWPAQNKVQRAIVGTVRTDFANKYFQGRPDEYILRQESVSEESIHQLWTASSVNDSRFKLSIAYFGSWALVNFCIGAFARAKTLVEEQEHTSGPKADSKKRQRLT